MERKLDINIDNVIDKLLSVRTSKVPKQVNLLEGEIKALCMKSKEIFMQQPIFLELEAPLKICGTYKNYNKSLLRRHTWTVSRSTPII
jgi:serine/threonine-protein phosphatase PP1 catalytic subunit